jgi:hypothetical protein
MAFVSTNQFGVTTTNLQQRYMAWLKTADAVVLEHAIDVVSADVCRMLQAIGILPTSITQAMYPNDFVNLGNLVAIGALGQYGISTASSRDQADGWRRAYFERLREIRANPAEYLEAYAQVDGVNTVRSHTESMPASDIQAARGLFWNPLNRVGSWTR